MFILLINTMNGGYDTKGRSTVATNKNSQTKQGIPEEDDLEYITKREFNELQEKTLKEVKELQDKIKEQKDGVDSLYLMMSPINKMLDRIELVLNKINKDINRFSINSTVKANSNFRSKYFYLVIILIAIAIFLTG